MTKRKAISKKVRFEIFKRDGFICQYCGAHPPAAVLHVDHIVAVAAGGSNETDNLITSCQPCNIGKGARDISVAPQALKDRAAEIAEREEQLRGYQEICEAQRERADEEVWRVVRAMYGADKSEVDRRTYQSIHRFIQRLGVYPVLEAVDIALCRFPHLLHGSTTPSTYGFRYFCGVCWKRIRELDGTNQNDQA